MTTRRALMGGGAAALTLLLAEARARADLALFAPYYENVARMTEQNDALKVRQLVGSGHSPDEVDDQGRTGLLIAAINDNLQIAAILIKAGAHRDAKDQLGNTPLHYAVERDHADMAQLLLDVGATVDPQNRNGMTPLMIAASRGYTPLVEMLLAKGANPQLADYTGRDAVSWAQDSHRPAITQALQRALAKR